MDSNTDFVRLSIGWTKIWRCTNKILLLAVTFHFCITFPIRLEWEWTKNIWQKNYNIIIKNTVILLRFQKHILNKFYCGNNYADCENLKQVLELKEKNSILDRDLNKGLYFYVLVLQPLSYPGHVPIHDRLNLLSHGRPKGSSTSNHLQGTKSWLMTGLEMFVQGTQTQVRHDSTYYDYMHSLCHHVIQIPASFYSKYWVNLTVRCTNISSLPVQRSGENDDTRWYRTPTFFTRMEGVTRCCHEPLAPLEMGDRGTSTVLTRYESMRLRSLHQSERTTARDHVQHKR